MLPEAHGWGTTEYILADLVDSVNALICGLGGRASEFEPYPRPQSEQPAEVYDADAGELPGEFESGVFKGSVEPAEDIAAWFNARYGDSE